MTADRVQAVAKFGFTERQARFLVTVMLHAGVCVPRQYASFAGTAYGQKVNTFFDTLVQRGYATACGCVHNRARLYHVHHRALYRAIGEPDSRYRRPVPASRVIERVMRLDGVLFSPELVWLATQREKVGFFCMAAPSLPAERLPHITIGAGAGSSRRVRLFPDDVPIGVESTGRVVFLCLVTTPILDDFRAVLQRHGDLLCALQGWTILLLFPRRAAMAIESYTTAVRDELAMPLAPATLDELRWYFERCRLATVNRTRLPSDARFRRAQEAFTGPRFRVLYRRWLTDGEAVFEVVSSPAIGEALAQGKGRIDWNVLQLSYRHLSPLASLVRSTAEGVEEGAARGEDGSAGPNRIDR